MAADAMPPSPVSAMRDEHVMDTRTPSPVQMESSEHSSAAPAAADSYKPDLSAEVAMLSTKLVNAINYQTNLDDSLQQTRHELEQAQKEIQRLRAQKQEVDGQIANGMLLRKANVDKTIAKLKDELVSERAARETAEKAKKQTEGELENLTSALFEEANTMVAAARKDTEAVERRNSQLRGQLNDTELLLASQQEQLSDLKTVMEKMEEASERDVKDNSVPSTPINATTAAFDALQLSPNGMGVPEVSPDHPLHFSQLLAPVLRNDISAYTDFQELLVLARRGAPHSRNSSNNANNLTSASQTNLSSAASSSPSLPGAFSFSASSSPQAANFGSALTPPLKESKFYKRTLVEDIEPTLRLDLAPGLSFLSRRTVLSSLLVGSLVVEPFLPSTKFYGPVFACALCGEHRKNEPYVRKHRFRTSEEDSAQRYPLCDYCLSRIRAAGDFVGFLRMVRDGHWRAGSEEEQKGAWEESVRLRERMFWARLGGGVVPAMQLVARRDGVEDVNQSPESVRALKSARASLESVPERKAKENALAAGSAVSETAEPVGNEQDVFQQTQHNREASGGGGIGRAIMSASSGLVATARPDVSPSRPVAVAEQAAPGTEAAEEVVDQESQSAALQTPETAEEPTTPFEDAQTDSQQDQLGASQQLQHEAEASNSIPQPPQTPFEEPAPPAAEPEPAPAALPAEDKISTLPPPPTERRPSAVLARVRAMEAKASGRSTSPEKKFPGAFD